MRRWASTRAGVLEHGRWTRTYVGMRTDVWPRGAVTRVGAQRVAQPVGYIPGLSLTGAGAAVRSWQLVRLFGSRHGMVSCCSISVAEDPRPAHLLAGSTCPASVGVTVRKDGHDGGVVPDRSTWG